jgi:rubrerythrin
VVESLSQTIQSLKYLPLAIAQAGQIAAWRRGPHRRGRGKEMEIEKALKTAIEYETRIRDLYIEAAERSSDATGQRVYTLLGKDEQNHLDYLNDRLRQWQAHGKITAEKLESVLPLRQAIINEAQHVQSQLVADDRKDEKQMLSKALKAEMVTSAFYAELVAKLSGEAQKMFKRFLEIEDGHVDLVQAELDYLSQSGYWLDYKEFDMEDI